MMLQSYNSLVGASRKATGERGCLAGRHDGILSAAKVDRQTLRLRSLDQPFIVGAAQVHVIRRMPDVVDRPNQAAVARLGIEAL
jgi:hypothetical protein